MGISTKIIWENSNCFNT